MVVGGGGGDDDGGGGKGVVVTMMVVGGVVVADSQALPPACTQTLEGKTAPLLQTRWAGRRGPRPRVRELAGEETRRPPGGSVNRPVNTETRGGSPHRRLHRATGVRVSPHGGGVSGGCSGTTVGRPGGKGQASGARPRGNYSSSPADGLLRVTSVSVRWPSPHARPFVWFSPLGAPCYCSHKLQYALSI